MLIYRKGKATVRMDDGGPCESNGHTVMSPALEFLQYAAECRDVAAVTNDVEKKATWNEMADRLLRCAELAAHDSGQQLNTQLGIGTKP